MMWCHAEVVDEAVNATHFYSKSYTEGHGQNHQQCICRSYEACFNMVVKQVINGVDEWNSWNDV